MVFGIFRNHGESPKGDSSDFSLFLAFLASNHSIWLKMTTGLLNNHFPAIVEQNISKILDSTSRVGVETAKGSSSLAVVVILNGFLVALGKRR